MYNHQALYLLVCLGTNQQKSAQKPIRYRNIKLEYYFNYYKTQSKFLLVDETYKNKRKH